jgi:hypothetical protein
VRWNADGPRSLRGSLTFIQRVVPPLVVNTSEELSIDRDQV